MQKSALDFAWTTIRYPGRHWQRLTASWRILPDFIIIGANRSGTTSLYQYLIENPQVRWAYKKEVSFFSHGPHFKRGPRWYRQFFPSESFIAAERRKGRNMVVGEGTPYYMFHPLTPGRIATLLPAARLIVVLRNPIDRAFSQYQQSLQAGHETLSFEEALDREEERLRGTEEWLMANEYQNNPAHKYYSYQARGRYAEQLQRWFKHIPRERFLIIKSESLYDRTEQTVGEVLAFLALTPAPAGKAYSRFHAGRYEGMLPETRRRLREYFVPHNQRLYELLGQNYGWEASE
jgi:hypothetical protein